MIRRADTYGEPNTIDQLKLLALVTMTIDHIGYFLFPDILWFRVIGRASFPLWLFVVGFHAAGQEAGDWQKIKKSASLLLVGTALILVANYAVSHSIFPLSVLFTILCVRIIFTIPTIRDSIEKQPLTLLLYAFLALPSLFLLEYGSLGLMFATLGFLVRRNAFPEALKITGFIAIVSYVLIADLLFSFSEIQEYCVVGIVFAAVYYMAQSTFKPWTALRPELVKPICFLTRNTYYYYVIHLLLLKVIGAMIYPPKEFFVLQFFTK